MDALQKLETEDVVIPGRVPRIKTVAAGALARSDPPRAEKLAESIDPPSSWLTRSWRWPTRSQGRRAIASSPCSRRATIEAKAVTFSVRRGKDCHELDGPGEKEKARALAVEYVGAGKFNPRLRLSFGVRLARIDPATALDMARELAATSRDEANQILRNVALALAENNAVEAERVLRLVPEEEGRSWMLPALAWKLARSDPARARRLVEESQRYDDSPQTYLYLACGLKGREPAAAEAAFWKGIKGIDRLLEEGAQYFARKIEGGPAVLMPLVEQFDPTLVPEVFWGALAARPPVDTLRSR